MERTGLPIAVVLTFADELARRGGHIDAAALSRALGHRVIVQTAGNRIHLAAVKEAIADLADWPAPALPAPTDSQQVSGWIDSVLLHPVWGALVFFATMFAFFQVVFTVAAPVQGWIEAGCAAIADLARGAIGIDWLAGLVADGLIGGVGGVLSFVPQITLLFLMISLLEASGYMSRAAFLMDRIMGRAGLEGRAFVAMLSGVACAIPGIMATRALPSAKARLATMLTVPLMTCSARLPVYTMLIAMLVPADGPWGDARWGVVDVRGVILFGMYVLGAVVAMLSAWVAKRFLGGSGQQRPSTWRCPATGCRASATSPVRCGRR